MLRYALAVSLTATAAFGIFPLNEEIVSAGPPDSFLSDGTYHFYYYGTPMWQWTFPDEGYIGVNFDATDNYGDMTTDPYQVTYVDSFWDEGPYGPYEITLYICSDDDGVPDFDDPLYESTPYVPEIYPDWDEHEVSPPVGFNAGEICWVVFSFPGIDDHPISDGDGNSGHSWISEDGYVWELMESPEAVDWCIEVYAEPGEPPDDNDPPYVTNQYPVEDDWPCGVPPTEDTAGCHWRDGDPGFNLGIDAGTLTFEVRDQYGDYQSGELTIDDEDIFDVIVVFDVQGLWEEDESYAVETECYDLAGNSGSAFWIFSTGFLSVEEKSFGEIKAGYAE